MCEIDRYLFTKINFPHSLDNNLKDLHAWNGSPFSSNYNPKHTLGGFEFHNPILVLTINLIVAEVWLKTGLCFHENYMCYPNNKHLHIYFQEIADKPDINEEVTPEQQEAYNLLVVKGSLRERASPQAPVMRGKIDLFRECSLFMWGGKTGGVLSNFSVRGWVSDVLLVTKERL